MRKPRNLSPRLLGLACLAPASHLWCSTALLFDLLRKGIGVLEEIRLSNINKEELLKKELLKRDLGGVATNIFRLIFFPT